MAPACMRGLRLNHSAIFCSGEGVACAFAVSEIQTSKTRAPLPNTSTRYRASSCVKSSRIQVTRRSGLWLVRVILVIIAGDSAEPRAFSLEFLAYDRLNQPWFVIKPEQCSSVANLFPVRPGVILLFVFLSSEGFDAKALRALVADGDFRRLAAHIANAVCVFGPGVGSQGDYLHALPPP
jgi:hypothetical protein